MIYVCSVLDDPRSVQSVLLHDCTYVVGVEFAHGMEPISRLEVYREAGPGGFVPWLAVYCGEKLVARASLAGAVVVYEEEEKR